MPLEWAAKRLTLNATFNDRRLWECVYLWSGIVKQCKQRRCCNQRHWRFFFSLEMGFCKIFYVIITGYILQIVSFCHLYARYGSLFFPLSIPEAHFWFRFEVNRNVLPLIRIESFNAKMDITTAIVTKCMVFFQFPTSIHVPSQLDII